MDAVSTLLKCLKSKRYISDIEKAKAEVSTERITLRKEDDLFIRDAITGYGTILKEDLVITITLQQSRWEHSETPFLMLSS